jgi:transaldolase
MSKSKLDTLKTMTTIVADTGDIESIKQFSPTDATTNPSLIMAAAQNANYRRLIEDAVKYSGSKAKSSKERLPILMDKLFVNFGAEILKLIPGRVSTEVDARLSFDKEGSIKKAHDLIKLYQEVGIEKNRVLIKLASTWEGAQAATVLEKEGIHCNMTLLFSLPQAIACAEASATLVSPFVGRILDWYKKAKGISQYAPTEDPGVISVTKIYNYFKHHNYKTQVMGASFRNIDEILELAGCDLLTLSPQLLAELQNVGGDVPRKLDPEKAKGLDIPKINIDEKTFRLMLNDDQMATEKLSDGIRKFAEDSLKLENLIVKEFSF